MAIVNMSNFNLFTFDSNRENLLHDLQKFEHVHFVDLDEDEDLKEEGLQNLSVGEEVLEINEKIAKVRQAITILSGYHEEEPALKAMIEGKPNLNFKELEERASKVDYLPIYEELAEFSSKTNKLEGEEKELNISKEELEHWIKLEYPINDLRDFKQSKVFLGTLPKAIGTKQEIENMLERILENFTCNYTKIISEDDNSFYLFTMVSNDESEEFYNTLRSNSFYRVEPNAEGTPSEEINTIDEKLDQIAREKEEITNSIKSLVIHLSDIELVYEYLMNKRLRVSVSENFLSTENVNLIKGYIPTDMEDDFRDAIEESNSEAYYLEIEEADRDDSEVPILLKNSRFGKAFESVTSMFALPRYNEIDPTPLLAPFYVLFFGMMVADLAYGLIMLIATVYVLKRANLDDGQREFAKFFFYLSLSVSFFGAIYGGFFGDLLPIKGLVNPAQEYEGIMIASIIFGVIHLFYGIGVSGYMHIRDKRYLDAFADAGVWYLALGGAIVFGLSTLFPMAASIKNIAKWIMILGLVGIVATGGRNAKSPGAKLGVGLYELYGLTGYIGDFVSYTRLMALGLASGFIASAVNMIARMLFETGIFGIIFGVVVIIFGQSLNIFLSLLGAYVHTIRLIYVEFFGKFYEGGGTKFNPFRNEPEFINIREQKNIKASV